MTCTATACCQETTIHHPFGMLKARMGSTHFLTKRLPRASTKMSLHVLAYNFKRVMRIMGAVPLMQAMRAQPSTGIRQAYEWDWKRTCLAANLNSASELNQASKIPRVHLICLHARVPGVPAPHWRVCQERHSPQIPA